MSIVVPASKATVKLSTKSASFLFTYMRRSWRVERLHMFGHWGEWSVIHVKSSGWSKPYRVRMPEQGITDSAAESALHIAWMSHYRDILDPSSRTVKLDPTQTRAGKKPKELIK